ncbi:MAG: Glycosyltransferase, partial [Candidatus Gottesmanbacteria bacterium GW2011_GWC2_39_8]
SLAKIDSKNEYFLYSRKKLLDFKKRLPRLPAGNFRHCVDYFKKGPDRVLPELDIFHTSSYDLERPKKAERFIVTIHDVIIKAYPYGHSEKTIKEVDGELKRVLGEADLLIADSNNTKADMGKFYQVSESKIKVIYPGVNISDSSRLGLRPRSKNIANIVRASSEAASREQYILFVGTIEPRKNIQGLIKAFNLLKKEHGIAHKLIIAGMKGWMYEDIFKEYENSAFKNDIIFKGYISDQELARLYKNASVFVYPSFYEGFGFPILEAFGYGVPVVTSKTSSCGEIAGDSALLVNPERYQEIVEAILKIISDSSLRQGLIIKGFERAELFTWQNTSIEFLNCLTNT